MVELEVFKFYNRFYFVNVLHLKKLKNLHNIPEIKYFHTSLPISSGKMAKVFVRVAEVLFCKESTAFAFLSRT
jgi:hypothetical protein